MGSSTTTVRKSDVAKTRIGKDKEKQKKVRLVSVKGYTKVVNGKTIKVEGYSYNRGVS